MTNLDSKSDTDDNFIKRTQIDWDWIIIDVTITILKAAFYVAQGFWFATYGRSLWDLVGLIDNSNVEINTKGCVTTGGILVLITFLWCALDPDPSSVLRRKRTEATHEAKTSIKYYLKKKLKGMLYIIYQLLISLVIFSLLTLIWNKIHEERLPNTIVKFALQHTVNLTIAYGWLCS
ncbi:similar to Saccharomyces cerevisiae YML047C PRM6 Pheromone-regulated protein, predicted to have 2 transmembrane segments [Maudiozyma saulgeensis]|uniref:Similar to Saccharomyces cerevisiae YML047C PRM6 Pheromone-regulated protein, predicted to have 2 transmembrane segments n=1 Tax=Maudiozyma saulgeensis TaxID=1789683 RepID=A0A1X7R288_9SACH|nr:similar to Saccharomyces cerevisiae YML047C PRM6 Pheromone-regulated protein, predicted to have 2 transmembrane segments [Kazachstania saulgeensis]